MPSKSIGQLEADLAAAVGRGDWADQMVALRDLAEIYATRGDADKALAYQAQAIDAARKTDAVSMLGEMLYNAGMWRLSLNEPGTAVGLLQEALSIARRLDIPDNVLNTLSVLAQAHAMTRPTEAIPFYEEARDLARELGDPALELHALNGLAYIGEQLGQQDMIFTNLSRALEIAEGQGESELIAPVHMSLGLTHAAGEDFEAAVAHFRQAVDAYRAAGDEAQAGRALGNLGTAYARLDDLPAAREALQRAVDLFTEIGLAQDARRAQLMVDTIEQSGRLP